MTDGDRLLRAILDDPENDAPRLVYADWLEEFGDDDDRQRAEFIRVQVERAKLPPKDVETSSARAGNYHTTTFKLVCGGEGCRLNLDVAMHRPACRWRALRDRERELLEEHLTDWVWRPVPDARAVCHLSGDAPCEVNVGVHRPVQIDHRQTFRRGFVDAVTLPTAAFLEHAGAIFRAQPVTRVTLADRRPAQAYGGHCWFAGGRRYPDPDIIPRELFPELRDAAERHGGEWIGEAGCFRFPFGETAAAVLSAAAVAFGRNAARLPALVPAATS